MSKLLQLRGGTTAEHATFTGALREVTVDTTKDTLVVHDGAAIGGFALPRTKADIDALNINADTLDGKQLATIESEYQAFANAAAANVVDTAPATLDTLNELAAALGDDPNFATTVTNSIATKLPLAGGTVTGNVDVVSLGITGGTLPWTAIVSGDTLIFAYNGSNKMKLDGSGNITVTGNVTAYGIV